MAVRPSHLATTLKAEVWEGEILFSSDARSWSEEHNCRLGSVLQTGSKSKQLGRNVGRKPEKEPCWMGSGINTFTSFW